MTVTGHKFQVGQQVIFTPDAAFAARFPTQCSVARLLPREGVEFQYHVECALDGQLRRANESQLRILATNAEG